jgi:hypothetical protein
MTMKILWLYEMHVMCVSIKYMHYHTSLYSKENLYRFTYDLQFSKVSIIFQIRLNFLDDIKAELNVNILIIYYCIILC